MNKDILFNQPAFNNALRIYNMSKYMASYISVENHIKSDFLFFEEVFFFYFLNNVALSILEAPAEVTTHVLPILLDLFEHENIPGYINNKNIIDTMIHSRFRMYFDIMYKNNEKLSKAFFLEAFENQAICINNIQLYNSLIDTKNIVLSNQDLSIIIKSLTHNQKLINSFITKKALKKLR